MDIVSLGFVLLLILLSGGIAYGADWLGRKLGKKRLTMAGMRPRHTAAVLTVASGMGITILTIGILVATSEPVRVWLVQGRLVQQKLQDAEAQLGEARTQLGLASRERARIRAKLEAEGKKLQVEQMRVADATRQAKALREQAGRLRLQVAGFKARLQAEGVKLRALQTQYAALFAQRKSLETNIATFTVRLKELSEQNLQLDGELRRNEAQLKESEAQIKLKSAEIDSLKADKEQLLASTEAQIAAIGAEKVKAQSELLEAQTKVSEAEAQVGVLRQMSLNLNERLYRSRYSRLIVDAGDELGRVAVKSGSTQAEVRAYALALLGAASSRAQIRGATAEPGTTEAAKLAALIARDGTTLSAEAQIDALVRAVANRREEQVLLARAAVNVFQGEFVPLGIQARANPMVYRPGELIAETKVDGRLDEKGIAAQIVAFVQSDLSRKAVRDGMIPAYGQESPLGEIPSDQLLAIVRAIRDYGKEIRLQFLASFATRAADNIKMELRLR